MSLVNLLLLDMLETSIYLGGIQLTNDTCMVEGLHMPFVERTIFTRNKENFRKKKAQKPRRYIF
jgi:hypothetical protein